MYADVMIDSGSNDADRLSVPVSAVLDTGARQAVLVDKGNGRFEPRAVKLGVRGDGFVEVTDGLAAGDMVVTSANFLIDAESNLKAALKGFTADAPAATDVKPMSGTDPMAAPASDPMKPMGDRTTDKPMTETVPAPMPGKMSAPPMTESMPEKMPKPMKPANGSAEAQP